MQHDHKPGAAEQAPHMSIERKETWVNKDRSADYHILKSSTVKPLNTPPYIL
uniref:Uncharacterized protein n=1 Tax=Arion vulgaris TaxID=1028688 RepID=A0A0B7B6I4_9EUPU